MFEYVFEWLSNLSMEIIVVIVPIIIYISYVLYKLLTKGAKPVFEAWAIYIIELGSELLQDEIEMSFKGSKINRLTKNIVVFWNAGKKPLDGKDIFKDEPIRFEYGKFDGYGKVLSAILLKESRKTNNFSLKIDEDMPNIVNLNFSYLEPGEGAVIELLHTTNNDRPEIKGEIKGVPNGIIDANFIYDELWPTIPGHLKKPLNIFAFIIAVAFMFYLVLAVMAVYPEFAGHPLDFLAPSNELINAIAFLMVVIFLGLCVMIYLKTKKKYPVNLSVDKYIKRHY